MSHRCPAGVPTSVPSRKSLFSVGLPRFSTIFEKKVRHTCATELRKPFFLLGLHFPSPILPVGQGECGVRIEKCGGQKKNSCQLSAISFQPGRKFRISKIQTGSKCPVGKMLHGLSIFLLMRQKIWPPPAKSINTSRLIWNVDKELV